MVMIRAFVSAIDPDVNLGSAWKAASVALVVVTLPMCSTVMPGRSVLKSLKICSYLGRTTISLANTCWVTSSASGPTPNARTAMPWI